MTPLWSLPGGLVSSLSRRQFLQAAGLSLVFYLGHPLLRDLTQDLPWQVRVAYPWVVERQAVSLTAQEVAQHRQDEILAVEQVVVGSNPDYNLIWYKIAGGGYIHSGGLQPVETRFNLPMTALPDGGALVEVTIPFTDVRALPDYASLIQRRLYYSTTYWAAEISHSAAGQAWYRLEDDRGGLSNWGRAEHFRPVGADELSPLSPEVPAQEKRIQVSLAKQWVTAYEGDLPVFMSRASTGFVTKKGEPTTPLGDWSTFYKRPSRHMAAGDPAGMGYDLPGVPWVSYFTTTGVSLHGTYWHNDYGTPHSHGCVNLPPAAAKWIYRWSLPVVPTGERLLKVGSGTRVIVS